MENEKNSIDWLITLTPFAIISAIAAALFVLPEQTNGVIEKIRFFLGDSVGCCYLVFGIAFFLVSIFLAFSKYGKIILGERNEGPKYSFFSWGCMMFTCGLAADILFYSFSEWIMYAANPHIQQLGDIRTWAGVFPLFHWSFIPWSFYLVLAVVFGFMIHVRKSNRHRFSEACRPLIGKASEGFAGRIIDLFALFALLAGTATTFSIATPLMSELIIRLFNIPVPRLVVTIVILVLTCAVYTYAAIYGFKGIGVLAKMCVFLFFSLLVIVLFIGGQGRFIVENGLQSFGIMVQNFFTLSTYTDPTRENFFPQDWTIYYWAYWIVWCISAPFFIGNISRGRSVKQLILGGYVFGVGSTIASFVVLGNYSLGLQLSQKADFMSMYDSGKDLYMIIIDIIDTLPAPWFFMGVVLLTMVCFYATSFDSIAYTAACYSYKKLEKEEKPGKLIILFWCIMLIIMPIALVFSESSMSSIQSVSIISAFPIGIIMIMMLAGFFKSANKHLEDNK